MPHPEIKRWPSAWQANTLSRHFKSWILPQGSRSVLYKYMPNVTEIRP